MAIHIEPEKGVAQRTPPKLKDLAVKASAAARTVELLHENGLEIKPNQEDKDVAAALAVSYAEDPDKTSKAATPKRVAHLTPATLLTTAHARHFALSRASSLSHGMTLNVTRPHRVAVGLARCC